ncbi:ileal sodium/bile acid cotransporter-like [Ptychodera flava]|uniref:ileal sodium/bile acid cotransporter-like n=1 Tax=Ptychodera flava TaxID=63121 RepID=UPI00396A1B81
MALVEATIRLTTPFALQTYAVGTDFHHSLSVNGSGNDTDDDPNRLDPKTAALKKGNDIMITCVLVIIMVGMGCSIVPKDLLKPIRRPAAIFMCLFAQFAVVPLVAFAMCHAIRISSSQALGALVIASSPGGPAANLFTLIMQGDIPLSLCLTTFSTVVSMGLLPLCMFIYSRSWTSSGAVIPFKNIAIALALVVLPPILGMAIRWKLPKVSVIIGKVAGIVGMIGIVANLALLCLINPKVLISSWQGYFLAILLPLVGFISSYVICVVFRRKPKTCHTVGFNCCMKNVPVAITLISLSYSGKEFAELTLVPLLYGIFSIVDAIILCIFVKRLCKNQEDEMKKVPSEDEFETDEEMEFIYEYITVM